MSPETTRPASAPRWPRRTGGMTSTPRPSTRRGPPHDGPDPRRSTLRWVVLTDRAGRRGRRRLAGRRDRSLHPPSPILGTRWVGPTDFLLETPDLMTLRTLPALDPAADPWTARPASPRYSMTRRALRNLLATLALAVGPPAAAEGPRDTARPSLADPIGSKLFPPELIMAQPGGARPGGQAAGSDPQGAGEGPGTVPAAPVAAPGREPAAVPAARCAAGGRGEGAGSGGRGHEAGDGDQAGPPGAADPDPEHPLRHAAEQAPGAAPGRSVAARATGRRGA